MLTLVTFQIPETSPRETVGVVVVVCGEHAANTATKPKIKVLLNIVFIIFSLIIVIWELISRNPAKAWISYQLPTEPGNPFSFHASLFSWILAGLIWLCGGYFLWEMRGVREIE